MARTRKFSAGILGALLTAVVFAGGVSAPAHADERETRPSNSVFDWYTTHGVDSETAQRLVEKLEAGFLTDANTGVAPVSTTSVYSDGWDTIRSTYEDGSISLHKIQRATESDGEIGSRSVGDCDRVVGGSGYASYYACAVFGETDLLTLSFRADYTLTNAGVGSIGDVFSPYQSARAGTASTPTLSITKSQSNSSGPASAVATSQFSGSAGSFTARLYLYVAGTAWSDRDWD